MVIKYILIIAYLLEKFKLKEGKNILIGHAMQIHLHVFADH